MNLREVLQRSNYLKMGLRCVGGVVDLKVRSIEFREINNGIVSYCIFPQNFKFGAASAGSKSLDRADRAV
jgi:hypothetical protein